MGEGHPDRRIMPAARRPRDHADTAPEPEFDDLVELPVQSLPVVNWPALRSPAVARAVTLAVVAVLALAWPGRSVTVLARLAAVGLGVAGLTTLWQAATSRIRRPIRAATGVAALVAAIAILLAAASSLVPLGRLVGAATIASGVALVGWTSRDLLSRVVRSGALVAVGTILMLFPTQSFRLLMTLAAIAALIVSVLVVVASLDGRTPDVVPLTRSTGLITRWLESREHIATERDVLFDGLFVEGAQSRRKFARFLMLMTFATAIAAFGVIADSTAVVIGAMLVAPLMTPLMAMAVSLVMGWPRRLGVAAAVAASGIVLAIALACVIGWLSPAVIEVTTNSQILARSNPTIVDLLTAIAAGAAGAYGLSRPDVSDALPGVAIAISLVPPLAVVGLAYSQGAWSQGNGALLLFMTNALAIVVVGGITFVLTGVTPIRRVAQHQHRVRTAAVAIAGAVVIVLGGLFLNGVEATRGLLQASTANKTVVAWLGGDSAFRVVSTNVDGSSVQVVLAGPAEGAPSAQSLAERLTEDLGRPIAAEVRVQLELVDIAPAGG